MSENIVNRGEIIATVSADTDIPAAKVETVLRSFEGAVARALASGSEVRITGFGTFRVVRRAERTSRNLQTGEPVQVAARNVPRFAAGKGLRDAASIYKGLETEAPETAAVKSAAKAPAALPPVEAEGKSAKKGHKVKDSEKAKVKGKKK